MEVLCEPPVFKLRFCVSLQCSNGGYCSLRPHKLASLSPPLVNCLFIPDIFACVEINRNFAPQLDQVAPLQEDEGVMTGTVPATVYLKYFKSGTGVAGVVFFVLVNIVAQTSYVFSDWWLSHWSVFRGRLKCVH